MRKILKPVFIIAGLIALMWVILTIIVQITGEAQIAILGEAESERAALIVYDPDPFYNLDEQVCRSFAVGLAAKGWAVEVATVAKASGAEAKEFDLYVFCANTYNWAPDWSITRFIKNQDLSGKPAVAITLGSGATSRSKRIFENCIQKQGANLMDSKTYWLLRPNDESRLKESNVKVAVDMANSFGMAIAERMKKVLAY